MISDIIRVDESSSSNDRYEVNNSLQMNHKAHIMPNSTAHNCTQGFS